MTNLMRTAPPAPRVNLSETTQEGGGPHATATPAPAPRTHQQRNDAQIAMLLAALGPAAPARPGVTFNPTVWCINQGCHAPIPAGTDTCPECNADQVLAPARLCACGAPKTAALCDSCDGRR